MKTNHQDHTVVVLGASDKPQRYSNMAVRLLKGIGYRVIPVHPRLDEIEQIPVTHHLSDIQDEVHTLTMYVGPLRSATLADDILALKPGRVIFNPGSESETLEEQLQQNDIPTIRACTLVMLQSGQF
jgi:predicted CoA-binding protein